MKDAIIKELENRGYKAELTTVNRNNVKLESVLIGEGATRPIIYLEQIMKNCSTVEEMVNEIIDVYEKHKTPDLDLDRVMSKPFVLEHITIALQRNTDDDIVKKPTDFVGIEKYLIVQADKFSYKVTDNILDKLDIGIDDAWIIALDNLKANTVIKPISKILAEISGIPEEKFGDLPMSVITNKYRVKGASAILNREALKEYAKENNTDKVYFIPSSIHEGILVPYTFSDGIDMLAQMVKEVNASEVGETEQLADEVFVIDL